MAKRVVAIFFILMLSLGLLFVRILSISQSDYAQAAVRNNTRTITVGTARGTFYDCNGLPLVNSSKRYVALLKPTPEALSTIEPYVSDEELSSIREKMSKGYPVSVDVDTDAMDCPDITVVTAKERYADSPLAVHLIGHLDSTGEKGETGLEKSFDSWLQMKDSDLRVSFSVDAHGRLLSGEQPNIERAGYDSAKGVRLTIDRRIQELTEESLSHSSIERGAVVVLETATGKIRAMASCPAFHPNDLAKSLNDADSPLINRALTPYAVGSIFKPVIAAAALEAGISASLTYTCTGAITQGKTVFHCHELGGHGTIDMEEAIEVSCNPYFINLALKLEPAQLIEMADRLGFGTSTALADNLTAPAGTLPKAEELNSPAAVANFAFGQGTLLATPLQLASLYACIANDGGYQKPVLVEGLVDDDGNLLDETEIQPPLQAMSESTARSIQRFLTQTVEEGSGKHAKPDAGTAAGKTATAQTGWYDGEREILHTWFAGYFPADQPEYAIVVLKEDGSSGATDGAPVFKEIAEGISRIKSETNTNR
uniref:peptidoglycan D,D-transpeptidase FtsI family protein n=1 Tax=Candidatus Fimivicinus sp. TaxID=3056640 RepID=UPI003FEE8743